MDKPDFSGLNNFDLILLRHATVEAGFEEDKEFVKWIDEELRSRVKEKEYVNHLLNEKADFDTEIMGELPEG